MTPDRLMLLSHALPEQTKRRRWQPVVKVALGTETGEAPGRPGATRENIGHV